MRNTIILPCNYPSAFQDERYGKGMRLHNISQIKGKENPRGTAYCTGCTYTYKLCKVLDVKHPSKSYDKPVNKSEKKKESPTIKSIVQDVKKVQKV